MGDCARVFVSHSARDREFVRGEIIACLHAAGIETWYSEDDIRTADHWERSILAGLRACDWFLVVMSRNSARSEWVKDELHWAMEHRAGRIVPVLIGGCEPQDFHIRLARIQYVQFKDADPQACDQLVQRFAAPRASPPPERVREDRAGRGFWTKVTAAVLLAVAIAVYALQGSGDGGGDETGLKLVQSGQREAAGAISAVVFAITDAGPRDDVAFVNGDRVRVRATVPAGYKTSLFWIGGDGKVQLCEPFEVVPDRDALTFYSPGSKQHFSLLVPAESGTEMFLVCASRDRLPGIASVRATLARHLPLPTLSSSSSVRLNSAAPNPLVARGQTRGIGQLNDQPGAMVAFQRLYEALRDRYELVAGVAFGVER